MKSITSGWRDATLRLDTQNPDAAGGYANCVMLHLLANRACGELFGGGEPAVLCSSLTLLTWHSGVVMVLCRPLGIMCRPSGVSVFLSTASDYGAACIVF